MASSLIPFDIIRADGSRITGEYKPGRQIVIFSHGFDVRRDSNGLFHDIAAGLPDGMGCVLFDYHVHRGSDEILRPFSEQVAVLHDVIAWTHQQLHPISIHLIAHSMGCKVASLAAITAFDTVTYLAPAMRSGPGFRTWFTTHPGARQAGDGWEIRRRSGKTTHISERFFTEHASFDPVRLLAAYAKKRPLHIIYATEDRFINPESFEPLRAEQGITLEALTGDHNFTGEARNEIVARVASRLNGRLS